MPVKHYDIPNQARFLTYSCFDRLPLFNTPDIRNLYLHEIAKQSVRLTFDVIAYVIMPEHIHMIVVPRDGRVGPVLRGLKQGFARRMLRRMTDEGDPVQAKLVGPHGKPSFWMRGGGHDRNLRSDHDIREKIGYIHQNPVRRGLVDRALDWKWSSAGDYAGGVGVVRVRKGW
ncbi:MAG: hypothetical protein CMJ35_09280 [Phycisphaerae bacterium]|nr:hypothetical protein [Phycisphaerae bacterium]MBM91787.1 hypothetical protein [Phycisphaerae bacterium]HCT44862.1 hypothetical protein [Phycisphaerales bacterium]|tara:strand:- start:366 stop:881 length:516 start_codon:yes stop_codon:yes gene_type:complete